MVGWMVPLQRKHTSTRKATQPTEDCTAVTVIGMKQGNAARQGGDKLSSTALLAGVVVLMLCILFYMAEHPRVPMRRFTPSWTSGGGGEDAVELTSWGKVSLWEAIAQRATNRSQSGRQLKILFMGDSITDGSAAGTKHPRFQSSGSCSYRFSFLNAITGGTPSFKSVRGKPISLGAVETVGPFSSNCGGDVVPAKCLLQLSERVQQQQGGSPSIHPFVRHGATSGIRATTLLHGESWSKRASEFEKSGLVDAPVRSPQTAAMEALFRSKFPQRNVSDIAVWVSQYRPDVITYLLGTNDIRWGMPVQDLIEQHLPRVILETLLFAEAPLAEGSLEVEEHVAAPLCRTYVFVSTLYPRHNFSHEVKDFNQRLIALRDLRRSPLAVKTVMCEGYSRPTTAVGDNDLSALSRVLLCERCVRIVNGGATALWESGAKVSTNMDWDSFVDRLTFDGLHPTDEGDAALGRQLAFEIMSL